MRRTGARLCLEGIPAHSKQHSKHPVCNRNYQRKVEFQDNATPFVDVIKPEEDGKGIVERVDKVKDAKLVTVRKYPGSVLSYTWYTLEKERREATICALRMVCTAGAYIWQACVGAFLASEESCVKQVSVLPFDVSLAPLLGEFSRHSSQERVVPRERLEASEPRYGHHAKQSEAARFNPGSRKR